MQECELSSSELQQIEDAVSQQLIMSSIDILWLHERLKDKARYIRITMRHPARKGRILIGDKRDKSSPSKPICSILPLLVGQYIRCLFMYDMIGTGY